MSADPRRWGATESDAAVVHRALAQLELPADVAASLALQAVLRGMSLQELLADVLTDAAARTASLETDPRDGR
jgi:hypothetical protein